MPESRTAVEGECWTDHPSIRIAVIRRAVVIVISAVVRRSIVCRGVAAVIAVARAVCIGGGCQTADHRPCYQSTGKSRTETMETPCFRRGGRRHGSQAKSGSGGQCHCCFPHAVLL